MFGTAFAADTHGAAGHEEGLLSSPEFWVAIAFLLFVAVAGKKIVQGLSKLMDDRTALIKRTLGEAEALRAEAQRERDEAEKALKESASLAEGIIAQAKKEAEYLTRMAAEQRQASIARREQQAADRIAQAEAAATKEVRDLAVDVAMAASRALLREQVAGGKAQALVDEAIAELPRRLH
ncbi:MAG: F0F1 ATP synthase subunit B [Proteobacteria bacterium]|nr:F0F1 ATP synthase subunit B [Pseudomonadota bacterium]